MISRIFLHNFKAFENLNINIKPITLFFGPNNSGKSSILAALRILSQTIESFDPQVVLLLDGIMGDFGTYKDIIFGNSKRKGMQIALSFKNTNIDMANAAFVLDKTQPVEIILNYMYRTIRREIILKKMEIKRYNKSAIITSYSRDSEKQVIEQIGIKKVSSSMRSILGNLLRMTNFMPYIPLYQLPRQFGTSAKDFMNMERHLRITVMMGRKIESNLRKIDYIGPMRSSPMRTYTFTGEKRARIGSSGENAANILAMDSARGGARSLNIAKRVSEWLNKAGFSSSIKIRPLSDRHYEIRVKHPITKEDQNIADVGYGNSQIIPVLVGGYNMTKGGIYIVEEPEIHLHPRAQAELGDFLIDLYAKKVQSIVETHSEYLVIRIQQHIAKGLIPADDVAIYYVYPNKNGKIVNLVNIDQLGQFTDEWPEGFFPERLNEAKKLSKIRFEAADKENK